MSFLYFEVDLEYYREAEMQRIVRRRMNPKLFRYSRSLHTRSLQADNDKLRISRLTTALFSYWYDFFCVLCNMEEFIPRYLEHNLIMDHRRMRTSSGPILLWKGNTESANVMSLTNTLASQTQSLNPTSALLICGKESVDSSTVSLKYLLLYIYKVKITEKRLLLTMNTRRTNSALML